MDVCYERSTAWCRMSVCPTFSPSKDESQPLTTRAKPHTSHETLGTSCQQLAESQKTDGGDVCFTQQARPNLTSRHAHVSRRHSVDGTGREGPVDASRFHPYLRQLSEGAVTNAVCLQRGSSPFSCLQEVCNPQMCCLTFGSSSESQTLWEQYDYNDQCSHSNLPAVSDETFCSHSQQYLCSTSASPPQEVTTWPYTTEEHSNEPNYSFQSLSFQINQRKNSQPLFPKPIYSYSILIFMALKNSETGSLPVSEIYSFMTENFPYFKTAPDGWKNSVRHNLSLNKSFEKLEGKNGNSSRKGCLWALNPAKVEKMQEELHKWRRKDPVSVRRSMARPDDLDLLLGQMPKKLSDSLALRAPCSQRHTADIHPGNVDLIATGKVPLAYRVTHQDDFSAGLRSLQDSQSEGDTYDVDVLNPSLTDLQLKGNLWEELQEDSLGSHLRSAPTPMCITSRGLGASLCPTQLCRYHSARQSDLNGSCSGSL
ncbi:forkhead box protein N1 isoform X3 [Phyllopteryx taeniolatus]|uniref:forkhead box protein N1 isoform X3 n=1 Tax=Phyllopteryx taeniolatus TaxID=161469 RepID=UPI002AD4C33E|nr:forkhead box protein N1 isoform X3 [Phyllopteryx taeniolatus]